MTCDEAEVMLHALIDDELDAGHAREVETHAAGCARCGAQLASYRDLRQALRGGNLRYTAPPSLRRSIDRAVPSAAATDRRTLLKGFALRRKSQRSVSEPQPESKAVQPTKP